MLYEPGDGAEGDALKEALEKPSQRISMLLEIDWDRDGNYYHVYSDLSDIATSVNIDRQSSPAIPEEVQTFTAHSSAEMKVTLHGRRDASEDWAHQQFSPWWRNSLIYGYTVEGTPVRYSRVIHTDLGDVPVRQFTGWIRSFKISRANSEVELTCSDVLDLMNAPVTLPRWARTPMYTGEIWAQAARSRPIELTWAVEDAFTRAGSSVGPAPHPSCQAYFSCAGSFLPSVGTAYSASIADVQQGIRWQNNPPFQAGKFSVEPTPSQYSFEEESGNRKNFGTATTPRVVRHPSSGGPSDMIIGFGMWVNVESDYTPRGNANSNWPFNNDRRATIRYYFTAPTFSIVEWAESWYNLGGPAQWLEMTVRADGAVAIYGLNTAFDGAGNLPVYRYNLAQGLSPGHHYYDARVRMNGTTYTVELRIDGQVVPTTQSSNSGVGGAYSDTRNPVDRVLTPGYSFSQWQRNSVVLYTSISCSHAQVYAGPRDEVLEGDQRYSFEGDCPRREGRPLAVMTAGSQTDLTWIPPTTMKPAWDVLQELMAAELAILHTDEYGTRYFIPNYQAREIRNNNLDKVDSRGLLISDDRLLDFVVTPSIDLYRNQVSVEYNERWGKWGVVWEPDDWRKWQQQRYTTIEQAVPLSDDVMCYIDATHSWGGGNTDSGFTNLFEAGTGLAPDYTPGDLSRDNKMRAVRSANSSAFVNRDQVRLWMGTDPDGLPQFWLTRQTWDIPGDGIIQYTGQPNVQGASGVPAASSTIFTNAIWVYGWKYGESESGVITVRDEEEVAKNGVRELVIPASDWRSWQGGPNNGDGTYGVAESLLQDLVTPAPLIDSFDIPADPRLQLLDVVSLESEGGITGRIFAQVEGITRNDTPDTFTDVVTARVIDTPDEWLLGIPGRTELGQTTNLG